MQQTQASAAVQRPWSALVMHRQAMPSRCNHHSGISPTARRVGSKCSPKYAGAWRAGGSRARWPHPQLALNPLLDEPVERLRALRECQVGVAQAHVPALQGFPPPSQPAQPPAGAPCQKPASRRASVPTAPRCGPARGGGRGGRPATEQECAPGAHPGVDVGRDVLRVGHDAREYGGDGAVDRREHLAAAQHAGRPALRDEHAVWRQLPLHHAAVELLGVQLRARAAATSGVLGSDVE